MMLSRTKLYWDEHCVVDSLPVPVVKFHLAPQSRIRWSDWGADYGSVSSKKIMIFGYKLHMLITLGGLIIDFELAPASKVDLAVGCELLSGHRNRIVIGDKAYVSAPAAEDLWHYNRICLLTKRRKNLKKQPPKHIRRLYDSIRQMIETVTLAPDALTGFRQAFQVFGNGGYNMPIRPGADIRTGAYSKVFRLTSPRRYPSHSYHYGTHTSLLALLLRIFGTVYASDHHAFAHKTLAPYALTRFRQALQVFGNGGEQIARHVSGRTQQKIVAAIEQRNVYQRLAGAPLRRNVN